MKAVSKISVGFILIFTSLFSQAQDNYAYFGLEPDIITNYVSNSKKIGYVRVTVELMLADVSYMDIVDHHQPLIRDALIDIISKESEATAKSLVGREEIRKKASKRVKSILKKETGQELIKDVLFTKYLYH